MTRKVPIYDDYGDDMYAILNNDNHETCHHDFNFHSHDSYIVEFAPTSIDEKKFAYVESNKFSMLLCHCRCSGNRGPQTCLPAAHGVCCRVEP